MSGFIIGRQACSLSLAEFFFAHTHFSFELPFLGSGIYLGTMHTDLILCDGPPKWFFVLHDLHTKFYFMLLGFVNSECLANIASYFEVAC